jgi:hypothetical protein
MLQAYALQEVLDIIGHTSYILDFWPYNTYDLFRKSLFRSLNIKFLLRELLLFKVKLDRKRAFLSFVDQKFRLISLDLTIENNNIDAFVIGSDQLWNSGIVKEPIYWGYSPAMKNKLLISYAISAGNDAVRGVLWGDQYLSQFNKISVREDSLHSLLQQKGVDNIVVLDPTLLHMRSFYAKIQKAPNKIRNKYVLIYQVMIDELANRLAEEIARENNLDIIEIAAGNVLRKGKNIIKSASPEEFLWYIDNAEVIITTSFHGTVFSIIYHKDFYVVDSTNKNDSRMSSLLSLTRLMDRIVSSIDNVTRREIDWQRVDRLLSIEREKSISFLKESLQCD